MQSGLLARKVYVLASVKRADCDTTEYKSVQIFVPYESSFRVVFWEEGLGEQPLLPEILGQPAPIREKSPIFNR